MENSFRFTRKVSARDLKLFIKELQTALAIVLKERPTISIIFYRAQPLAYSLLPVHAEKLISLENKEKIACIITNTKDMTSSVFNAARHIVVEMHYGAGEIFDSFQRTWCTVVCNRFSSNILTVRLPHGTHGKEVYDKLMYRLRCYQRNDNSYAF